MKLICQLYPNNNKNKFKKVYLILLNDNEKKVKVSYSVMSNSTAPILSNSVQFCSPPGSSVHGMLQAKILEWVAISISRRSSQARGRVHLSCIAGRFLPSEPPGKPWWRYFPRLIHIFSIISSKIPLDIVSEADPKMLMKMQGIFKK